MLSYEDILQIFWDNHNPTVKSWSKQYRAVIFFHNSEQEKAALASKEAVEKKLKVPVYTDILPFNGFYLAEDYHQKYYLQSQRDLSTEIKAYYEDFKGFTDSTAAARLNGYVAGYVDVELLLKELDSYGLSKRGEQLLLIAAKSDNSLPFSW